MDKKATQLLAHLSSHPKHAIDPRTQVLMRIWDGKSVYPSQEEGSIRFTRDRTMVLGRNITNSQLLLAMAQAASDPIERPCQAIMLFLVLVATEELGWSVTIDCSTCHQTGICSDKDCPKCTYASTNCNDTSRPSYPALLDKPGWLALSIMKKHHPDKTVRLTTSDMLYQMPSDDSVITVVVDPKSGMVVPPAPSTGSRPERYEARETCFMLDEGNMCVTLPSKPPVEWFRYVGQNVDKVVDQLKRRYPHAAVKGIPQYKLVPNTWRHDRIMIRYNDETKAVTHVPFIA
jgi:hypothetical protein